MQMNHSQVPQAYAVTVGFSRVQVVGLTRDDAIQQARRVLCSQLPRLYDVIRALDPCRFQVEPLGNG
jgi:hypothetical protein